MVRLSTRYALNTSASGVFPASGTVEAFIQVPGNQRYHITRMAVATNQNVTLTTIPVCAVYVDSVADANLFDRTYSGHMDQSDCDLYLERSQRLVARWTGGIAGTTATLSIFGDREVL